ncbi:AAA family ATPase [Rhodanobacter sp. Si-c]|uniref:AAA family ATPase n=1 Tax=Rhodanobacter lycopersici TaxID=3162487 RepID=A0ABV3QI03_9GAMM
MRISKITIRSFRSIESAEIIPSEFNVLAGQNNHGKTNFFEAIDWFYSGGGDMSQIAYKHDSAREVSVEVEYTGIQDGIEAVKNEKTKESFRKFAGKNDVIRVIRRSSDGGKRQLWDQDKGEWTSKNFAGFDKAFNDCLPRLQYVSTKTKLSEVSKYGRKTPIGEMLSGVLTAILEKSPQYIQFREKFNELFSDEKSQVKVELDALAGKVRIHLEQQFPECTKVDFSVSAPEFDELLKNFETSVDDGVETTAEEKGDGMQRALMLAIIKTYSEYRRDKDELGKSFLFLIDEAELHLHPTAQRQLKNALVQLAQNGDQVFINTHSSVLVADNMQCQTLWRVLKSSGETGIRSIGEQDKPELVYELLGGSPADLLFPNNFLIVEGRSEEILLNTIIRRFYAEQPRIKVVFAEGDLERQQKSMDAINIAFTPLYQTPVYRDRLVILCDKPNKKREDHFSEFCKAYPDLTKNGQLVVAPVEAIEETYPAPWKKTTEEVSKMKPREKTNLAQTVGEGITRDGFEKEMAKTYEALMKSWEKSHK